MDLRICRVRRTVSAELNLGTVRSVSAVQSERVDYDALLHDDPPQGISKRVILVGQAESAG